MCAIAAPARAASIAESAICSGVTGTSSLRPVVSPAPVTAQVMNASQFTPPLPLGGLLEPHGHLVHRAKRIAAQTGQPLTGDPLAWPPDVQDHDRPAVRVQHGRRDAARELLELLQAGAVPITPDLRQ